MPCTPRMQTGCRANGPIDLRGNPLVSPVYHTRAQLSGTLSFCKHTCMGRDVTRELSLQVQRQSVNFLTLPRVCVNASVTYCCDVIAERCELNGTPSRILLNVRHRSGRGQFGTCIASLSSRHWMVAVGLTTKT